MVLCLFTLFINCKSKETEDRPLSVANEKILYRRHRKQKGPLLQSLRVIGLKVDACEIIHFPCITLTGVYRNECACDACFRCHVIVGTVIIAALNR